MKREIGEKKRKRKRKGEEGEHRIIVESGLKLFRRKKRDRGDGGDDPSLPFNERGGRKIELKGNEEERGKRGDGGEGEEEERRRKRRRRGRRGRRGGEEKRVREINLDEMLLIQLNMPKRSLRTRFSLSPSSPSSTRSCLGFLFSLFLNDRVIWNEFGKGGVTWNEGRGERGEEKGEKRGERREEGRKESRGEE